MNNIDICITLKATRSLKVKVLMFANLSGVTFATIGLMFCIVLLDSQWPHLQAVHVGIPQQPPIFDGEIHFKQDFGPLDTVAVHS
jgi:hypothetical protein